MIFSLSFSEDADNSLEVIDQRKLPLVKTRVVFRSFEDVCRGISNMTVQGSPLLGIVAAQGMAFANADNMDLLEAKQILDATRPTSAVTISRATSRMLDCEASRMFEEVKIIAEEERVASEHIRRFGSQLLLPQIRGNPVRILLNGNAGSLSLGSALGCILAQKQTSSVFVWVCETRPRLQGTKLTAWELAQQGVDFKIIVDSAAGSLLRAGKVDCVLFGAERICGNGDVVSTVGTYALCVCAREAGVPVYCTSPMSTVDLALPHGDLVEIEERDEEEVLNGEALEGTRAFNPAFDVTPHKYITAIVTEHGVCYPPFAHSLFAFANAVSTQPTKKENVKVELPEEEEEEEALRPNHAYYTMRGEQKKKTSLGGNDDDFEAATAKPRSVIRQYEQKRTSMSGDAQFSPPRHKSSVRIAPKAESLVLGDVSPSKDKGHYKPMVVSHPHHSNSKGHSRPPQPSSNNIFG